MAENAKDAEVKALLDRTARAVTSGDGRTMAEIWEAPALVVGDDGVMAVGSAGEVERWFGGSKDQYNELGITDTRPEIQRLDWPTERIAIVTVRWPWLDAEGVSHGYETSTYTLRRDDAGNLRFRVAVMHGAVKE